jgi:hypothetical protein
MVELWQASMPSEWKCRFGGVDILVYSHYCVLVENSEVRACLVDEIKKFGYHIGCIRRTLGGVLGY